VTCEVLLFFPRIRKASTSYRSQGSPPIGLGYLTAVSEENGYSAKIIDLNQEKSSLRHVKRFVERYKPNFVGVSFVTEARHEAFKIFQIAKAVNPGIITIAGGPHASLTPEDTLAHIIPIDYIVIGEGEKTFIALLDSLSKGGTVNEIPGLAYRDSGEVRINKNKEFIKDLDSLPFPSFPHLTKNNYQFYTQYDRYPALKTIPILTSRGCPFHCNFCATTEVWGSRWRYRSPVNVLKEIGHNLNKYNIEAVWFVDDNFNSNPERMLQICQEIRKKYPDLKWICNIRVDNLKEDHVKIMAESGCVSVEFGAESGSQRILDEVINKKIKVEKILEVDAWCHKHGIITDAQFIISHPTETYEEAIQTSDLIKKLKGRSTLQILKIYPGTKVERVAREKSILKKDFSWAISENHTSPISSIIGDAPLYLENMSLSQVMRLMSYAWTDVRGLSTFGIAKKVIRKVTSPKELWTYLKIGIPIVVKKMSPKRDKDRIRNYTQKGK